LSNPSKQVEATPEQVIKWTEGKVIIATGSPFKPVTYKGQTYHIAQCNNSYIFPGIGLGVVAVKASRISDDMLRIASETLAAASPLANTGQGSLLPALSELSELSKKSPSKWLKLHKSKAWRWRSVMMNYYKRLNAISGNQNTANINA